MASLCLQFHHPLLSYFPTTKRPHPQAKFCLPLNRAEPGKVKLKQTGLESSAILRRPLVGPPTVEDREEEEEEVVKVEEEEEVREEEEEGRRKDEKPQEWVWEDTILEDTVPLVGFVRMILHSGKYESGDRLSPEHENAIRDKLLPYHPEYEKKVGCGIDYIKVGFHQEFSKSRCLFIVRTDGEVIDFSFWKCIKGLIRTKYPLYAENFINKHFSKKRRD